MARMWDYTNINDLFDNIHFIYRIVIEDEMLFDYETIKTYCSALYETNFIYYLILKVLKVPCDITGFWKILQLYQILICGFQALSSMTSTWHNKTVY